MNNRIFIPGNVPSSKNGRRNFKKISLPSKAVVRWRKNSSIFWATERKKFKALIKDKEKPYKIYFEFVRGTKHKFDYLNPAQTLQDEMVHHRWIEDDNCDEIIPFFAPYRYNCEHPGVFIYVV